MGYKPVLWCTLRVLYIPLSQASAHYIKFTLVEANPRNFISMFQLRVLTCHSLPQGDEAKYNYWPPTVLYVNNSFLGCR